MDGDNVDVRVSPAVDHRYCIAIRRGSEFGKAAPFAGFTLEGRPKLQTPIEAV
jgi:hypothetical protein